MKLSPGFIGAIVLGIVLAAGCDKGAPVPSTDTAGGGAAGEQPAKESPVAPEPAEGAGEVQFGDRLVLLAVAVKPLPEGLGLELSWKSLLKQKLDGLVPLHVVNEKGKVLAQADYKQDVTRPAAEKSSVWVDRVVVPYEKLAGGTAIGTGVLLPSKEWLVASRGTRDWGNKRLLIPLPPKLPATASPLRGFLEVANSNSISGWAWKMDDPGNPVRVEILVDDQVVTNVLAAEPRADLAKGGVGSGNYGFRVTTPASVRDGRAHQVGARVAGAPFELKNSPRTVGGK